MQLNNDTTVHVAHAPPDFWERTDEVDRDLEASRNWVETHAAHRRVDACDVLLDRTLRLTHRKAGLMHRPTCNGD